MIQDMDAHRKKKKVESIEKWKVGGIKSLTVPPPTGHGCLLLACLLFSVLAIVMGIRSYYTDNFLSGFFFKLNIISIF